MATVTEPDDLAPPDPVVQEARYVKPGDVEFAKNANEIMLEHGTVHGRNAYPTRHEARWRARKLINLLTERLKIYERWQLKERTSKTAAGYVWAVEKRKRDEDD